MSWKNPKSYVEKLPSDRKIRSDVWQDTRQICKSYYNAAVMQAGDEAANAGIRMSPERRLPEFFFVLGKIMLIDENYYKLFLIFWRNYNTRLFFKC